MYFETLVEFLRKNGFTVKLTCTQGYKFPYEFAEVSGNGILGGFCEPNDHSYGHINGSFCADNANCFDKWSNCPLKVEFPLDDREGQQLLGMLKYLGSDEGFKHSSECLNDISYQYTSNSWAPNEVISTKS